MEVGDRENERGRGREREKEERGFSTHPPVGLIVLDDCLRIMAETHNSDYNACSFNNAVTSRGVVYVNVPVRARRHRVRRLFRLRLSSSLTLLLSLLHSFSLFLRGTQPPPFSRHNHLSCLLFSAILYLVIHGGDHPRPPAGQQRRQRRR